MRPCRIRCNTPTRSSCHQALSDQERLRNLFDGLRLFANRDSQRAEPNGAAAKALTQGAENGPIQAVETAKVHLVHLKRGARRLEVPRSMTVNLCPVAHAPQEAVRDTWGASRPRRDLSASVGFECLAKKPGRSLHDRRQVMCLVKVEMGSKAEAIP